MARIARVSGPLYDFVDLNVVVDRELSISDLRKVLLRNAESETERHSVILISADQLPALEEKLRAVLGHRDLRPHVESGALRLGAAVSIGGGGIGDVRRLYRVRLDGEGTFLGLAATESAIKIVERPEKNLANTDIDLLEEALPRLTAAHPDRLTRIDGVLRGVRRQKLTLVQRLEFVEDFTSFVSILDDLGSELCNAVMILEVLAQAAEGLGILHGAGIAHRDFKADAVVIDWRRDPLSRALRALAERLPDGWRGARMGLLRRAIRARIYDYDTVAREGGEKDPSRTTSSSENARVENPRELAQVFLESDQYPLGIAALRLLPDLWSEVKSVMSSGMAVAVPMKIMMLRNSLAERRQHFQEGYATLYGCEPATSGRLIDLILRLIAFEPEERFESSAALVAELRAIQAAMSATPLLSLIRAHPHLFEDVEELVANLRADDRGSAPRRREEPTPQWQRWGPVVLAFLAMVLGGALVWSVMVRPEAPSPVETVVVVPPAPVRTPPPTTPAPAATAPWMPPRLDLGTLDPRAIDALRELAPGGSTALAFATEDGVPCRLEVGRAPEGSDTPGFSYRLTIGERVFDHPRTATPVLTVREVILSDHFSNWCEASSPDRIQRFIERMPAEPPVGGPALVDRFTVCNGDDARPIPLEVGRPDFLTFRIRFGGLDIDSTEPRKDLCSLINGVAVNHTGRVLLPDCAHLELRVAPTVVVGEPGAQVRAEEPQALEERKIDIENRAADIVFAAREISSYPDNVKVTLQIDDLGSVVILKRSGGLYYEGRNISSSSTSSFAALVKAIQGTVDSSGGM